jgi:hypothetical protein
VVTADASATRRHTAAYLSAALGLQRHRLVGEKELSREKTRRRDLLFVGLPRDRSLLAGFPAAVVFGSGAFELNGRRYPRPGNAFFGVADHPRASDRIVALFLADDGDAAEAVARKVPHYGKYSYLAFSGPHNRDKGTWPVESSPLAVRFNGQKGVVQ